MSGYHSATGGRYPVVANSWQQTSTTKVSQLRSLRRRKATERELKRLSKLRQAFDDLRHLLPSQPSGVALSKKDTLVTATQYIRDLTTLLNGGDPVCPSTDEKSKSRRDESATPRSPPADGPDSLGQPAGSAERQITDESSSDIGSHNAQLQIDSFSPLFYSSGSTCSSDSLKLAETCAREECCQAPESWTCASRSAFHGQAHTSQPDITDPSSLLSCSWWPATTHDSRSKIEYSHVVPTFESNPDQSRRSCMSEHHKEMKLWQYFRVDHELTDTHCSVLDNIDYQIMGMNSETISGDALLASLMNSQP